MTPWAQTGAIIGVQILVAAFVYGQLVQRVKDQGGWLKKHDAVIDKHEEKLLDHEGRISHIEGRKAIDRG